MPHWFVYVIRSLIKDFVYVGSTDDLRRRLSEHNAGLVQSTKAYKPYEIIAFIAVRTEHKARTLEKYFKTGSGKAILSKENPNRRSPAKQDVVGPPLPQKRNQALGEVQEWLNWHAWRACVRVTVPWVRIPPSPLECSFDAHQFHLKGAL